MKNNYKLTKKAWGINWDKISEGYYYNGNIKPVYAETLSKAKSLLLKEASEYKLINKYGEETEITYINVPVIRYKHYDKFIFENNELRFEDINDILRNRERQNRFDEIKNNSQITHCFIMKRDSYYCNNYKGYSENYFNAGVYTKEEAISEAVSCDEISIIPINNVEHNKKINQKIKELKSKLILKNNIYTEFPCDPYFLLK